MTRKIEKQNNMLKVIMNRLSATGTAVFAAVAAATVTAAMATSCTAPMDIDTRASDPVIVVYGELSDDGSFPKVSLSSGTDYFSDAPVRRLNDARVWIESDGRTWPMSRLSDTEGGYIADESIAVSAGGDYTLNVEVDFSGDGRPESYSATTRALPPVALDSIKIVPQSMMGINHYSNLIYGQEPTGKNFYLFQILVNDVLVTDKLTEYMYMDDTAFNGTYLDGMLFGMYLSREHEEMIPPDRREDVIMLSPGDRVTLRVLNVEEGYFNFVSQCKTERGGSNPFFGGPYSNIESNILPSGAGYFAAYCSTEVGAIVQDEII